MLQIKATDYFAIKKAEIMLNGITVVSGINGCGKSTLAKSAYELLFTALNYDKFVEEKIEQNILEYRRSLRSAMSSLTGFVNRSEISELQELLKRAFFSENNAKIFELIDRLIELCARPELSFPESQKSYYDSFVTILKSSLGNQYINENNPSVLLNILKQKILDERELAATLKSNRQIDVFQFQWANLFGKTLNPSAFNVYENDIPVVDRSREVVLFLNSLENIFYIDTPMCLSDEKFSFWGHSKKHWDDLNAALKSPRKMGTSFDYHSKEDLGILKGDFESNDDKETFLYQTPDKGPLFDLIKNGATGLKSFVMLQTLYRKGLLNAKTLLILDEPEAHLHPQWIVHFARFIVLLRKETGCMFLISSHSTDMISALKSMSEKELDKGAIFYLAETDKENKFMYNFHNYGDDIEPLFEVFNKSFRMMDRYVDEN